MTSRNSRSSSDDDAQAGAWAPMNVFADLPRRQLEMMSRTAAALYRGSEAMRKIQQQAAHRASAQHDQAAERLRTSSEFGDLLAVQAELLRFGLQESAQYWQQLATTAMKVQAEMAGSAGQALDTGEPSLESLQKAFAQSLDESGKEEAPQHH